jgi:hypothetical protein
MVNLAIVALVKPSFQMFIAQKTGNFAASLTHLEKWLTISNPYMDEDL